MTTVLTKRQLLKNQLKEKQESLDLIKKEISEIKEKIRDARYSEMCGCPICVAELNELSV